jgi:anti-sigma factor RsiW
VTCAEFVELVTAYLEGQLDAETAQRFVDHMALCAGCDRYVEQIRRTITALGTLPPESLSDQARDTLLAAFRDWRAA